MAILEQLPGCDPHRLQELEEVTRLYAGHGRTAFGLGDVAPGGWMVGAPLVHLASRAWGRLRFVLAAPLCFGVVVARRWYQRFGAVMPIEVVSEGEGTVPAGLSPRTDGFVTLLLLGAIPGVGILLREPTSFDALPLPHGVGNGLVVTILLATAVLAWRVGRGYRDTMGSGLLLMSAGFSMPGRLLLAGDVALLMAPVGRLGTANGIHEHRHFRRLERRLLALQAQEADDASDPLPERP